MLLIAFLIIFALHKEEILKKYKELKKAAHHLIEKL